MKPIHVAFLFFGPELDPKEHRTEIKTNKFKLTSVGVSADNWEQAIATAKKLVVEGAQIIELCGRFGPAGIAKISEALNYKVPVGGVLYGTEAYQPILDLLKD
jgi:hypothetical protein